MKKKIAAFFILVVLLIPVCAYAQNQTLIMYYSKTGKTKIVAEELKVLMPDARVVEMGVKGDGAVFCCRCISFLLFSTACRDRHAS